MTMISVSTKVTADKDAAKAVEQGTREVLFAAADRGFATAQEHVPHGATSNLAHTAVHPQEAGDGSIVWGYNAPYARYVEQGTRPHWPPIEPLKKWARRVLGDESAAWAVQHHIAQHGTPAQPYVEPGIAAMTAHIRARGLKAAIKDNL